MNPRRARLAIKIGDVLELAAAAAACWGVYGLAGLHWMLLAAAVLMFAFAELVYDGSLLRVPLPRRPRRRHPVRAVRTAARRVRVAVLALWLARARP